MRLVKLIALWDSHTFSPNRVSNGFSLHPQHVNWSSASTYMPKPPKMGHRATDRNFWVSKDNGAPPDRANRKRPPTCSLILLKTTLSMTVVGRCRSISQDLVAKALWNKDCALGDAVLILPRIPFRIDSHTAGTPVISVGRNSLMSPLQFRTDASVSVRTDA